MAWRLLALVVACWFGFLHVAAAQSSSTPGFRATYWPATDGADTAREAQAAVDRIERLIAIDAAVRWDATVPASPRRIRWRASLRTLTAGPYRLHALVAGRVEATLSATPALSAASDASTTPASIAGPWVTLDQPVTELIVDYYPPAQGPARLTLYWAGPDFTLEPLSADNATVESLSEGGDEKGNDAGLLVERGRDLYRGLRCDACHVLADPALVPPSTPLPAPTLTHASANLRAPWLRAWLTPNGTQPQARNLQEPAGPPAPRRMPYWQLDARDVEAIIAALIDDQPPQPAAADRRGDPHRGRTALLTIGCLACHRHGPWGANDPLAGPDLSQLSDKRPAGFVARWLDNPAAIDPDHRMPRFPLDAREVADLAAFLENVGVHEDGPAKPPAAGSELNQQAPPEQGREHDVLRLRGLQLLDQHCASCHRVPRSEADPSSESPSGLSGAEAAHRPLPRRIQAPVDWLRSCVANAAAADRPWYELTDDQRLALRAYVERALQCVPASKLAVDAGRIDAARLIRDKRCDACHDTLERPGGLRPIAADLIARDSGLAGNLPAMIPPSLRSAGDKFLDDAWQRWLTVAPPRRRPWLTVRMPDFHLADDELNAVREYFRNRERLPELSDASDESDAPQLPDRFDLNEVGTRLVGPQGFGCLSCHAIGDVRPVGTSLTAIGPTLSMLGQHVRPEWFDRWVRQPGRILPNIEMPSVQHPVPDVLSGNLDLQVRAIWNALNDPSFQPPASSVVRTVSKLGVRSRGEPTTVLTDCLRHPRGMLIRPMLCALPNQHNFLIDVGSGRWTSWWVGSAARQRTSGKSWYWEPAASSFLVDSGPETEIAIGTGSENAAGAGMLVPARVGQFVSALDYWGSAPEGGIDLRYRLTCSLEGRPVHPMRPDGPADPFPEPLDAADDAGSSEPAPPATVVVVDQRLTPIWGESIEAESADSIDEQTGTVAVGSGVMREITLRPISSWPGTEVRWYVAAAEEAERGLRGSELAWITSGASVELVSVSVGENEPNAGAAFSVDQRGVHVSAVTRMASREPVRIVLRYRSAPAPRVVVPVEYVQRSGALEPVDAVPGFRGYRLPLERAWMPTAIAWDSRGDLLVTSLKGRIWRALDTDGDGYEDQSAPVSDELAAPYGIVATGGHVDVINKYALLRLTDGDNDGFFESVTTLADGWGHTDDYHDWTVGLVTTNDGGYFVATACQQDERPAEASQWRGKILRLTPREPTESNPRPMAVSVFSAGHRFPMGLVRFDDSSLLVTDNQGNYNPFNELNHARAGDRFGFLNRWEADQGIDPSGRSPAVCLPHPWTRSVNGIAWLRASGKRASGDTNGRGSAANETGEFGPLTGQLVGCEYDTRRLVRMSVELVGGELQGAAYPMSDPQAPAAIGLLGPLCCAVSPRGDLYVGGIRDSGWGGGNNVGELVRLEFDPDRLPAGITEVTARPDGFRVRFTRPIAGEWIENPEAYRFESFVRVVTPAYGGDDQDRRRHRVLRATVGDGRRWVDLQLDEMRRESVYELRIEPPSEVGGERFFPAEAFYTLHRVPRS